MNIWDILTFFLLGICGYLIVGLIFDIFGGNE